MKLYFALALTGVPIGAMYALQALGIVIVYKTSRVFNFATGAIGLTCAYIASSLTSSGVPSFITLPIVVLLGVAIGVLMELSVRPVRGTLTRTIVTLGWLLLLQGAVGAWYTSQVGTNEPARLLGQPKTLIHIGVLQYGRDQVAVILIAAALAAGLAFFFRATALGTATRAVSEAPDAARLLGIRVARVNFVAWGIGGGISGLSGVLITPLLNKLDTTTLVIFTIQALAAALVGRLSSLPLTFAGGIGLGVIQPVIFRFTQVHFPSVRGTDELTALVVVLVAPLSRSGRCRAGPLRWPSASAWR
jgi:branched-subunit amino acid ABC-type transport system permease component